MESTEQVDLYKAMGSQLNKEIYSQSTSFPSASSLDLTSLLKWSAQDVVNQTDNRLVTFLEEATKVGSKHTDNTEVQRSNSIYNAIENILKARNQKCVAPPGLSLLTLVYVFGGRSRLICNMVSSTGAKGKYNLIKDCILQNSKETSSRSCVDGVEVFYSFDNMQKLFAIHRLYSQNQNKAIARVCTSLVKCYPDGLLKSNIQYLLQNNPMRWLHSFSFSQKNAGLVEILDKKVLQSMMIINDEDLSIILGRWDYDIQKSIENVESELNECGKDFIDMMVEADEKSRGKLCINLHLNENVRGNQKYCRVCKASLIDISEDVDENEDVQEEPTDAINEVLIDTTRFPNTVYINQVDKKDKKKLFPRIRNSFNENLPIYESDGCVFVNPNTFERLVLVFECIQKKTNTFEKFTSSITINSDNSVTVDTWAMNNVRQYLLLTVDGLPHKMAIDVIKNCFKCSECDRNFSSMIDVNKHHAKYKHTTYYKRFSNVVLNIGGLHLHMNMMRSFVSLSWNIDYSYLCNAIGFKSPKAQLFQQKVQDLHKCMDTYNARRPAKLREYARTFVLWCRTNNVSPNAKQFENWLQNEVQNESFKLNVDIDKMFGTALWLCHAGQRANHWKMYRAALKIFSGLFHVNGNSFYSIIDVYDEYLMSMMKTHNSELYEHLQTRLYTNMTGVPYCSQSHDARHEEANKKGQNMFPGNSLEELDLAFTIVDDIWLLRKEKFKEFGVKDSANPQAVVPNLDPLMIKMRFALRKSQYLNNPTEKSEAKSMSGQELHESLKTLFEISQKQRRSDILNVMRYNDFTEAFGGRTVKIPIFKDDKLNTPSNKDLITEIQILIYSIEDLELQILVREAFEQEILKNEAVDYQEFKNDLINQNYSKICKC